MHALWTGSAKRTHGWDRLLSSVRGDYSPRVFTLYVSHESRNASGDEDREKRGEVPPAEPVHSLVLVVASKQRHAIR